MQQSKDSVAPTTSTSAAAVELLTTDRAAREIFGVSERTFHGFRSQPWFTAKPRALGSRTIRWVRTELQLAALNVPLAILSEPSQLLRGRIERLKVGGVKL